jgi:hypothetical protein
MSREEVLGASSGASPTAAMEEALGGAWPGSPARWPAKLASSGKHAAEAGCGCACRRSCRGTRLVWAAVGDERDKERTEKKGKKLTNGSHLSVAYPTSVVS